MSKNESTNYNNLCYVVKTVLTEIVIILNECISKQQRLKNK